MTPRPSAAPSEVGSGTEAARWLEEADARESDGRLLAAVAALVEANRCQQDADVERRLLRLRHASHAAIDTSVAAGSWPEVDADAAALVAGGGLPVIDARDLRPEVVRAGILRHGCLHVRGLFPQAGVDRLVGAIDSAFAAAEAHAAGAKSRDTTPWFEPFRPGPAYEDARLRIGRSRKWVRDGGGVWGADSPRALFELLDTMDVAGLLPLVEAYLGERPMLSVNKCTLRRVGLDTSTDWHQDGAFLGEEIRTLNVWLALSPCGRDAPGLDVLPVRLDHVVERGTQGAWFDWAVGSGVVDALAAEHGVSVLRPEFETGDVLLFDQLFLHRTAIDPAMIRERYAIETWFFGPSTYPGQQVPLVP